MLPTKPYLIRAIYEWCTDQGLTPYLSIQVDSQTRVPQEFVRDGQIVLNVSAEATQQLALGNEEISFQARFNGASFPVLVPVGSVAAIYARENGQGIAFEVEKDSESVQDPVPSSETLHQSDATHEESTSQNQRAGHLTLVK